MNYYEINYGASCTRKELRFSFAYSVEEFLLLLDALKNNHVTETLVFPIDKIDTKNG